LKFLGILNIVIGVIYCLTIVGAIVGWVFIWIGTLLNNASTSLRAGYDGRNEHAIRDGMDKLAMTIRIIGILTLIGLITALSDLGYKLDGQIHKAFGES